MNSINSEKGLAALRSVLLILALSAFAIAIPAQAQQVPTQNWTVDPHQSVARLSLGSGADVVEIGLARVSGNVEWNQNDSRNDSMKPSFRLNITTNGSSDDEASSGSPRLTFTSDRVEPMKNGKFFVTGRLSVTRTQRVVTADGNEAYSGPVYGEPFTSTSTQEVRFVVSAPGAMTAANAAEIEATTSVNREAFPQLLASLTDDAWPATLVNDKVCEVPSNAGEDYAGAQCTGTLVAAVNNPMLATCATGGEGYSGFTPAIIPDTNHATIALNLRIEPVSTAALAAGSASGK